MATTINLSAAVKNFVIDQGQSATLPFTIIRDDQPLDLTDYDIRMQIRQTYADSTPLISATLTNGKIVSASPSAGTFTVNIEPDDTNSVNTKIRFVADAEEIEAVYDIELESPSGTVYKVSRGTFTILREVTRTE